MRGAEETSEDEMEQYSLNHINSIKLYDIVHVPMI